MFYKLGGEVVNSKYMAAFAALGMCALSFSQAHAETKSMGQYEYENSCAACHGASGTGGGPSARFLSAGVAPDLTVLQKNNGGVFPADRVYGIIDGSGEGRNLIHGSSEMPMWGDRYMRRTEDTQGGDPFTPEEREEYVKTRIQALVDYLASIQHE